MKVFLLGIVALSLLFVLAEILINDGETKKYTIGILRVVFVVSAIGLFFGSFSGFSFDFFEMDTSTQTVSITITDYFDEAKEKEVEKKIEKELKDIGINNATVNIFSNRSGENRTINFVTVNIVKSGIKDKGENIVVIEDIKKTVTKYIDIAEDKITVYGWV